MPDKRKGTRWRFKKSDDSKPGKDARPKWRSNKLKRAQGNDGAAPVREPSRVRDTSNGAVGFRDEAVNCCCLGGELVLRAFGVLGLSGVDFESTEPEERQGWLEWKSP